MGTFVDPDRIKRHFQKLNDGTATLEEIQEFRADMDKEQRRLKAISEWAEASLNLMEADPNAQPYPYVYPNEDEKGE